jgi:hypothetical protein
MRQGFCSCGHRSRSSLSPWRSFFLFSFTRPSELLSLAAPNSIDRSPINGNTCCAPQPELATQAGDDRYNDRLRDLSDKLIAEDLRHSRQALARFEALDVTGIPEQAAASEDRRGLPAGDDSSGHGLRRGKPTSRRCASARKQARRDPPPDSWEPPSASHRGKSLLRNALCWRSLTPEKPPAKFLAHNSVQE